MNVYLGTLGCRLNESEIEQMGRMFRHLGHSVVKDVKDAELCVINTCAVTGDAGRKSRQLIYQASRHAPEAKIIVTGCYSELEKEKVETLPGVVSVISNMEKDSLVPIVLGIEGKDRSDLEPIIREAKPGEFGRTRAFLKVQDGCDNRCTFCVTTVARGPGRSRALSDLIQDVQGFSNSGYKEVVLSGVHLGSYGRDRNEGYDLGDLVSELLKQTDIPRIRLSSLEPWDIPEGFFEHWKNPRLCRHFHLPLQSGSDTVLKRMARRTRKENFRFLVEEARRSIPGLSISSDMIVGFPGESEKEFLESCDFVRELGFCHMHIFRYSPRPGTAAARMPNQVSSTEKSERSRSLHAIAEESKQLFYQSMLGKEAVVLWEGTVRERQWIWHGLTDNYIRVQTQAPRNLFNKISLVRLDQLLEKNAGITCSLI